MPEAPGVPERPVRERRALMERLAAARAPVQERAAVQAPVRPVAPEPVLLVPVAVPLRVLLAVRSVWRRVPQWTPAQRPARQPRAQRRVLAKKRQVKKGAVPVAAVETNGPRTYGNWRRPVTAGLLGLGSVGTFLLFAGLISIIIVVMVLGLIEAAIWFGFLAVVMLVVTTKDAHGKSTLDRGIARGGWWLTRARGQNVYRSGPLGRTPWGTCQLPGIAAPMRLSEFEDSYGRPFALVHSPVTGTFAVVIGTEPDGAALVDPEQVDTWVADWGHWLRNLGDEPGIEGAAVTIETAPDSGSRLRREVEANVDLGSPAFAQEVLNEVVDRYPSGSSTVKAFVTITFNAAHRSGGKRRKADEMARELAARLPNLTRNLQATGAGAAAPLSAQQLCEVVRVAYDPAAAVLFDEAKVAGETVPMQWHDVGPVAAELTWNGYFHENAFSMSWEMTEAPRGNVQSGVLARLLAPHSDVTRKRVTLLYRPIDAARAAAIVEADTRAAEFRISATSKPSARDLRSARAAAATAQEEASGAGLTMFGMVVTATVDDPAMVADARATVDNLAATARLRLRPVYGSQDSAFAIGLPLGLVPRKHMSAPSQMKEKL